LHGDDDDTNAFTQGYWDEKYAAQDRVWSGRPNQRLVEHASGLPPGVALDVGCGEGADVVWLAERGWRVTGADVSPVALERARRHAGEAGVADRTTWLHVDLVAGGELPRGNDLVSAMYLHVPDADFDRVYSDIASSVRPGGSLLVCGHHPDERDTGLRNPRLSHLLFAPERVTALLGAEWEVEVADARTRDVPADDHGHGGHGAVATDTVVLAHREPS
jgi:2-polyprenyl-3-methyl-5-hydroxy-6-metoxy-1,4-benzoquinol methylase